MAAYIIAPSSAVRVDTAGPGYQNALLFCVQPFGRKQRWRYAFDLSRRSPRGSAFLLLSQSCSSHISCSPYHSLWPLVLRLFFTVSDPPSSRQPELEMTQARTAQLQIPSNARPGHVRSTSTSSIPNILDALSESPQSPISPIALQPLSPMVRPDVPPNTSQTLSGMATPALGNAGFISHLHSSKRRSC